jgi:Recombination endonuclease VII
MAFDTYTWHKEWHARNPGKRAEYQRAYRKRNPEKAYANTKRYREANPWLMRKLRGQPEPVRLMPDNCELCGKHRGKKKLSLDHDHETKRFRGWLCNSCNLGIGLMGDSLARLEAAVSYLKKAKDAT